MIALALVGVAHGYDRFGPDGDAGLRRVFEAAGAQVSYRDAPFTELDPEGGPDVLVIDLTTIEPGDDDWEAIRSWIEQGHTLVVSGDATMAFPELGERVFGIGDPETVVDGFATPRFDGQPPGFTAGVPLVQGATRGAPVAWQPIGGGAVVALADATALWNGFLVHPDNERFLTELITRSDELGLPIPEAPVIELGIGGGTPPTPPTAVANLKLLPFVIQVLLLWLVVVAWKGWPFRRNREPASVERADFSAHIAAVANHYRRLGASSHVDAAYARWLLAAQGRAGLLLAARRHGYPGASAAAFVDRVQRLADEQEHDQSTMEELCRLMEHDR